MASATCGSPKTPTAGGGLASGPEPISIIAAERGPQGFRLVAIDEHGNRRLVLLRPAAERIVRDVNPTLSPDGRWLVFASTRERRLDVTSLWIAEVGADAVPRRLTETAATDSHPTWSPDGRAIVFASTRAASVRWWPFLSVRVGGEFDLWRLAIDAAGAPGELTQLTTAPGHEITPTIASDGTIAYAAVKPTGTGEVDSHLEERAPDGTIRTVTGGPADSAPAYSPDGTTLVFARPTLHNSEPDSELWQMPRGSELATRLVDLPLTDESGPVWSLDGRYVFATSVLRGSAGNVLFSSVIYVDRAERPTRARLLGDRAGPVARLTPAIAARQLDLRALRSNPEYLSELARIMAAKIVEQTQR